MAVGRRTPNPRATPARGGAAARPALSASTLPLRRQIAAALVAHLRRRDGTQRALAQTLGITQARLNALVNGRAEAFSTDALLRIAYALGLKVRVSVTRPYG